MPAEHPSNQVQEPGAQTLDNLQAFLTDPHVSKGAKANVLRLIDAALEFAEKFPTRQLNLLPGPPYLANQ